MKHFYPVAVIAIFLFAFVAPLYAQSGCTDSPENPTVILGLLGAAGIGIAQLRSYRKKK